MSWHHYTTVDELREASRFSKERGSDFAVIWHAQGDELLAEVHDESLGGLGVIVKDAQGFDVGQNLSVVYAGSLMHAVVRHVEPLPGGEFVVGLECERTQ